MEIREASEHSLDILKEGTIPPQSMEVDEEVAESMQAPMASTAAEAAIASSAAAADAEAPGEDTVDEIAVDAHVESASGGNAFAASTIGPSLLLRHHRLFCH